MSGSPTQRIARGWLPAAAVAVTALAVGLAWSAASPVAWSLGLAAMAVAGGLSWRWRWRGRARADATAGPRPSAAPPVHAALLDALAQPAALLDGDGHIVATNAAWGRMAAAADGRAGTPPLGGSVGRDYLAGCRALDDAGAVARMDALQWADNVARAMGEPGQPGMAAEMELAGRHELAERWFRLLACPLAAGGALLQVEETTAWRQLEGHARESEARRRAVFETPAVGIAENRLDGSWISINPRLCTLTGYSREQLRRMDFRTLTHPDDRAADAQALQRLLDGEAAVVTSEKRYLRADGSTIWVSRTSAMVHDAAGGPAHVVSVINDISEYKRVQAELAEHQARLEEQVAERTRAFEEAMNARLAGERFLRSVADNLPDMVCYWDTAGICRFANRAYRQWFAPGGREIVGLRREEVLRGFALERGRAGFAAACAGQPQQWQDVYQDSQGVARHFWVHFMPDLLQGGQVAGVFVLASDISEIKAGEMRLSALNEQLTAARDRAEQASRAKTSFLANVSHEIRTPMNAIIGLTHLMQRDLRDDVSQARLDKVSAAAHHLLDVINDVLDLSKIESGKLRIAQTDFAIGALLSRVCALVGDRVRGKGLVLQVHAEGLPAVLCGDPTRVSQALLNLMSNAVKFTDRGRIELCCEALPAGEGDAPGGVLLRFTVRDTGIGVPPDRIGQLFNAFEQADASTTRRFGGTGLGLAITRRLAELMGGEVGVRSAPGQGSEFWFSARFAAPSCGAGTGGLPPEPPALATEGLAEVRARHEHQLRARHQGARVLLAEDNLINQEVAGELLRAAGLTVDVAGNGAEAVALARRSRYGLILMDMQMPEMDGLSATRQIRLQPAHARTPILAMTANAFGDDRQACLDAGMDDHLAKPVDPVLMYAMLDRWLPPREPAPVTATAAPGTAAGTPADAAHEATNANEEDLFAGIPGLAMSQALMYLPGRTAVYERVLRQFSQHYADGVEGLDDSVARNAWSATRRLLHSLRGACGAVGASGLSVQCRAIEARLDAEQDDSPCDAGVMQALQVLQDDLAMLVTAVMERLQRSTADAGGVAAVVVPQVEPGSALAPDGSPDERLDELQDLLAAADFRAGALHRTLEQAIVQRWGGTAAAALSRPLRLHDYEAALAALQALRTPAAAAPAGRAEGQ